MTGFLLLIGTIAMFWFAFLVILGIIGIFVDWLTEDNLEALERRLRL